MRFCLLFLFLGIRIFSQQIFSGKVTDEEQNPVAGVLVINTKSGSQGYSGRDGEFSVTGNSGDEIRFVHQNYDRTAVVLNSENARYLQITLLRTASPIEEVKIPTLKLTGDLNRDSRALSRQDPNERLRQAVGVPGPPEKPREKPAEFKRDVLKPLLALSVSPQAVYDLISGDARRKKSEYRYQDFQDHAAWLRAHVGDEYFEALAIPAARIPEFIAFCFFSNPESESAVKLRNSSKATFLMEPLVPEFLKRLSVKE